MSGKKRIIILPVLLALILTTDIFAQTDRFIRWQPVYGAGGYIIEIKDTNGRVIVEKEVFSTLYDISRLNPGKYLYRITTLNKLKQRGKSTSWTGFTIEKATIPEIRNVSRRLLAWSYDNGAIKVTGSGFDSKIKIFLRNAAENIETDVKFFSSTELEFEYNPRSDEEGIYDLVAVNDAGFETVLKNGIEIKAPEIPVIESLSSEKILHSVRSEILVRGQKLGSGAVPVIEDYNGNKLQVKYRNVSETELLIIFDPLPADKGKYRIYIIRDKLFISERKISFEIDSPDPDDKVAVVKETVTEKKGKDSVKEKFSGSEGEIYLGISWEYNLPLGIWADKLSPSPAGLHIYFSYQLKGFSFLNSVPFFGSLDFEAKGGYSQFDLSSGTSDEYYRIIDAVAGLNWTLPFSFFSKRLYPLIGINAGIAHSTVSVYNYTGTNVYSSLDPILSGGLTFRYRKGSFFADASCAWQRIFYVSSPMDISEISLRAGIIF